MATRRAPCCRSDVLLGSRSQWFGSPHAGRRELRALGRRLSVFLLGRSMHLATAGTNRSRLDRPVVISARQITTCRATSAQVPPPWPWRSPSSLRLPQQNAGAPPAPRASPSSTHRTLHAFNLEHAADLLDVAHHVPELVQVRDAERERVAGAAIIASAAIRFADVQTLCAEDLTDHGENPW